MSWMFLPSASKHQRTRLLPFQRKYFLQTHQSSSVISGSQTGIRGAMPCTGPLHLRPWIARGSTNHPCFSHSSFLRQTVGGRSWRCCNFGGIATFFVMVENDLNLSFLQRDQKIHSLSQNNMKYTSTKKTGQSTHYRG